MLLAEPTFNTKPLREQMVQAMFEAYGCPAVFLAKNAVLSSFATGRQTSLVVDAGHEGTVGKLPAETQIAKVLHQSVGLMYCEFQTSFTLNWNFEYTTG